MPDRKPRPIDRTPCAPPPPDVEIEDDGYYTAYPPVAAAAAGAGGRAAHAADPALRHPSDSDRCADPAYVRGLETALRDLAWRADHVRAALAARSSAADRELAALLDVGAPEAAPAGRRPCASQARPAATPDHSETEEDDET